MKLAIWVGNHFFKWKILTNGELLPMRTILSFLISFPFHHRKPQKKKKTKNPCYFLLCPFKNRKKFFWFSEVMNLLNVVIFFCHCKLSIDLKTYLSNDNSIRRFLSYRNYESSFTCRFFNWYDPFMNNCAKLVLYGLLNKIKTIERTMECWFKSVVWFLLGLRHENDLFFLGGAYGFIVSSYVM